MLMPTKCDLLLHASDKHDGVSVKRCTFKIDEDELALGLTKHEAAVLVKALAEQHGLSIFMDLAPDILEAHRAR